MMIMRGICLFMMCLMCVFSEDTNENVYKYDNPYPLLFTTVYSPVKTDIETNLTSLSDRLSRPMKKMTKL